LQFLPSVALLVFLLEADIVSLHRYASCFGSFVTFKFPCLVSRDPKGIQGATGTALRKHSNTDNAIVTRATFKTVVIGFVKNCEIKCHLRTLLFFSRRFEPNHPVAVLIDVAESHLFRRFNPVGLLAAAFIAILEGLVEVFEFVGNVLAGRKVDSLPGADSTVNILEAFWKKGAHGTPRALVFWFGAAMDATNSDAGADLFANITRQTGANGVFEDKDL